MFKKNRLIAFLMLFILLIQPAYAGIINVSSPNEVTEYTYYKVFDVTRDTEVGWRRLWCVENGFECDVVFYGANAEVGNVPWFRDDAAELLSNHKKTFIGIDNNHAKASTWQCIDDERTSMDGDLIWENGKIQLEIEDDGNAHYFMYKGSPWIKVVRKYAKKENSGVTLKACKSPYNGGETGLYLVTFDEDTFNSSKFQKYLYNNIPSDALLTTSTSSKIKDVPLGYYIVKAKYSNGTTNYVGDADLSKSNQSITVKDNNTVESSANGTITVYYEDEYGNTLLPPETFEGPGIGEWYEISPRGVQGYDLSTNDYPSNYRGWFQGDTSITFIFKPKTIKITVVYFDEFGNEIATPETISKTYGETYQTTQKDILGYKFKYAIGNTSGKVPTSNTTIYYYYTTSSAQTKEAMVTINYSLADGTGNVKYVTQTINESDWYLRTDTEDFVPREYKGWKISYITIGNDATPLSTLPSTIHQDSTITYHYIVDESQRKTLNATIKYSLDGQIQELETIQLSRDVQYLSTETQVGTASNVQIKDFDGWKFSHIVYNGTLLRTQQLPQVINDGDIIVLNYDVQFYKLNVRYVIDDTYFDIESPVSATLMSGEYYNYPPKDILGYTFKETLGNGESQDYIYKDTNITHVYNTLKSSVIIKYLDTDGNEIQPSTILTEEYGNPYTITIPNISGYKYIMANGELGGRFGLEDKEVSLIYDSTEINILIQYVDEYDNLLDSDIQNVNIGDSYNINPIAIKGYTYISSTNNTSGIITNTITIVFKYQRNTHNLNISYVNENGEDIANQEHLSYKYGETYATSPKNIIGYSLLYDSNNTQGTMDDYDIDVVYTYEKMDTCITVQYIDELGNKLAEDKEEIVKYGESYDIPYIDIEGYKIKDIPIDKSGIMETYSKTITFIYEKQEYKVEIQYINRNNEIIADNQYLFIKYQNDYFTTPKEIVGYKIYDYPSNASGKMGTENIVVKYVYDIDESQTKIIFATIKYDVDGQLQESDEINIQKQVQILGNDLLDIQDVEINSYYGYKLSSITKNNETINEKPIYLNHNDILTFHYEKEEFNVIVKYMDEDGMLLTDIETIPVKYQDSYNTEEKIFNGYELVSAPSNKQGIANENNIIVCYVYKCLGYSINVQYITNDNVCLDIDTIVGKYGDNYTTEEKTFRGYILESKTDNFKGKISKNDVVVYTYKPIETKLTVKYVDSNGNSLVEDEEIKGLYQNTYQTNAKDINGYKIKTIPQNANGIFDIDDIEVIYVYELQTYTISINYQDIDGNIILTSEVIQLNYGDEYEINAKAIDGYNLYSIPKTIRGTLTDDVNITFIYEKKQGSVVIHYINAETMENIIDNEVIIGDFYDEYSTNALEFDNYTLYDFSDNTKGLITKETIDVYYYYKPIIIENQKSTIIVQYMDEDGNVLLPEEQFIIDKDSSYNIETVNIDGYKLVGTPQNHKGVANSELIIVTFVYNKNKTKDAIVKVSYVDINGKELSPMSIINGSVGDPYRVYEKQITDYKLVATNGLTYGFMTEKEIIVEFIYEKIEINDGKTEEGNTLVISDCKENLLSIQLYNYNPFPIEYNGKQYNTGALIAIIPVKQDRTASIIGLPYGIYRIKEYKTTSGYSNDKNYYTIQFTNGQEQIKTGTVKINGKDELSLKGISFDIVNVGQNIIYKDKVIEKNEIVDTFIIDDNNATINLPSGLYEIRNITASNNFNLLENVYRFTIINNKTTNVTLLLKQKDNSIECEHNWDDGTVIIETSCKQDGIIHYQCTLCGETSTEIIEKLEHNFITKASTCQENGYKKCKDCGYTISLPKENHNWNDGKVVNIGSCNDTAIEYTCYDCFEKQLVYDENISANHTFETIIDKGSQNSEGKILKVCTKCGYTEVESIMTTIYDISLDKEQFVYSGSPNKPQVTVYDLNGNQISSEYYTIHYDNNVRVGKGKVTVKFKGVYKGMIEKEFEIIPLGTRILSFTSLNKGFTVKWIIQHKDIDGYEIQYSTKDDFSNANTLQTKNYTTLAKTVSGLNSNTKYYVRIRTYKGNVYSEWSETKEVETK